MSPYAVFLDVPSTPPRKLRPGLDVLLGSVCSYAGLGIWELRQKKGSLVGSPCKGEY